MSRDATYSQEAVREWRRSHPKPFIAHSVGDLDCEVMPCFAGWGMEFRFCYIIWRRVGTHRLLVKGSHHTFATPERAAECAKRAAEKEVE